MSAMDTMKIIPLKHLSPTQWRAFLDGQKEAAKVWMICRDRHREARAQGQRWPGKVELQQATKGQVALHSQSIQMVCHAFLANVETAKKLRKEHPSRKARYPWRDKTFYPILWPEQAVKYEDGKLTLPMGRGRESVTLSIDLPKAPGSCRIVWNDGFELHVSQEQEVLEATGEAKATVDLGQIHQAAVTTSTGKAIVISGRGIRAEKRLRNKSLGEIASKRSKCRKGSRRWKKLSRARAKVTARSERRCRDLQHKGTTKVIAFCREEGVGTLFAGNPDGVQRRDCGRKQNQRMSQWEFGRDLNYLKYKSQKFGIEFFTGSERGTSSQCPQCGNKQKVSGRHWQCRKCEFAGHRDIVGSVNMHKLAFGEAISFPKSQTYLRAGAVRCGRRVNNSDNGKTLARSSRPDAGQSCLRLGKKASAGTSGSPGFQAAQAAADGLSR
jgi:putative transposase